jgi:50S ribosomal subunit-associated GTPase HflX
VDLLEGERVGDDGEGSDEEPADPSIVFDRLTEMMREYPNCVAISAAKETGLDALLGRVQALLEEELVRVEVLLPYSSDGLLGLLHQRGVVEQEEYGESGVHVEGKVPHSLAYQFERYLVK